MQTANEEVFAQRRSAERTRPGSGKAFDETTKNIFTDDYTYTVSNNLFQPHDVLENLLSAEEGQIEASRMTRS